MNACAFIIFGDLDESIELLNEMEFVAIEYAKKYHWSTNIGLYFHCAPFNSIQSLHLHVIDCDWCGPSYEAQQYKNLTLEAVRSVLVLEKNRHK